MKNSIVNCPGFLPGFYFCWSFKNFAQPSATRCQITTAKHLELLLSFHDLYESLYGFQAHQHDDSWTNSRGAKCTLAVGFLKIDDGILPATPGETNAEKMPQKSLVPKITPDVRPSEEY